jgi:hypothetical protein
MQMASRFWDDDDIRNSTVKLLNHRADCFSLFGKKLCNVTAMLPYEIVSTFFEIQTPHSVLTVKPFVHMTIL